MLNKKYNILGCLLILLFAFLMQTKLVAQVTKPTISTNKVPADTIPDRYGDSKEKVSTGTIAPQSTKPKITETDLDFDYGGGVDLNIPDAEEETGIDTTEPAIENKDIAAPALENIPGQDLLKEESKPLPAATQNKVYEVYKRDIIKENKLLRGPLISTIPSFDTNKIPEYSDEVYAKRLKALPTIIPMDYNELVGKFIKMYVVLRRDQITRMLPRADHYYRIFEEVLDRYGLPIELKYLPVMESALIPHAKSSNGAGLWQLPYGTARLYGLEANSFIDERFDPVLSTEAAAQHLRNLYGKYHDWQLVIAAFNCGEGTVNKAVRQSGGKKRYSEVAPFLPDEAQSYVPLYTAAVYAMNYYPEHNLTKHDAAYNFYATDTIRVHIPIDLKEAANYIGTPLEELQFLNPAVKRNVVPRMPNGFPVTLPVSKIDDFGSYLASKSAPKTEIVINNGNIEERVKLPQDNVWNYQMDEYGLEYVPVKIDDGKTINFEYVVKEGDILGSIAETYDCTSDDLKRWNRLPNNKLAIGQVLIIKIPKAFEKVYKNIDARNLPDDVIAASDIPEIQQAANTEVIVAQYIMQEDDSLAKIATSFNITKDRLMRFNNLKTDVIIPGTILKIPAPLK